MKATIGSTDPSPAGAARRCGLPRFATVPPALFQPPVERPKSSPVRRLNRFGRAAELRSASAARLTRRSRLPEGPSPARTRRWRVCASLVGMVAVPPADDDRAVLARAVRKLRAGEPLTAAERGAVDRRGERLLNLSDTPPTSGDVFAEIDDATAEHLFDALVQADDAHGQPGVPWRDYFASRGVPLPPPRG